MVNTTAVIENNVIKIKSFKVTLITDSIHVLGIFNHNWESELIIFSVFLRAKQEKLVMNTLGDKAKPMAVLGVLALAAIVALVPHAFAQQGPSSSGQGQQGGIPLGAPYGQPNTPGYVDPNAVYGWSAGLAISDFT